LYRLWPKASGIPKRSAAIVLNRKLDNCFTFEEAGATAYGLYSAQWRYFCTGYYSKQITFDKGHLKNLN